MPQGNTTPAPLHDSPDWTWNGASQDPVTGMWNNELESDPLEAATYVGEVAGGERDNTGQEMPHGTGEMKLATGVVSNGTWEHGWILEGTRTDTRADEKCLDHEGNANGANIWKSYTGTFGRKGTVQEGRPLTGVATLVDGTEVVITDGLEPDGRREGNSNVYHVQDDSYVDS